MQCRQCGAEIAEKALICYRCGTATTEAKYRPVEIRGKKRSSSNIVAIVVAILLLLLTLLYYVR